MTQSFESLHVDLYTAPAFQSFDAVKFSRVLPADNIARAATGDLPYWNGYVWYSEPHNWGECPEHAPKPTDAPPSSEGRA